MKDKSRIFIDELINRFPPLESCDEQIGNAIDMILNAVIHKKKILVCGNGGSASDAMHIVGELMKSFNQKRDLVTEKKEKLKELYPMDAEYLIDNLQEAIPAISLVGETSLITAFSNDQAADLVFAQQVLGLGNEGDVLWAISTSGNSENVLYACKVARIKGMKIIGLSGSKGGKLGNVADITIYAPSDETYKIQEYHLPIYHAICLALENEIYGD